MSAPLVSVVIGVHNGAPALVRTLDSVLGQEGVDLEVLIVDDGSTDQTWELLQGLAASDPRLRASRQPHAGLTKALIAGCSMARGQFIARQDIGDISLPGRFEKQSNLLQAQPGLAFVACQSVSVGPGGEVLAPAQPADGGNGIIDSLKHAPDSGMLSPNHGSVMFRREAYLAAGGYRPEFYFAQDLDLWSRLIEVGELGFVPEPLYESQFAPGNISARYRRQQFLLRDLIREATLKRRAEQPENIVLEQAARIRPENSGTREYSDADANYFIGSCLFEQGDPAAMHFLRRAVADNPLHLRAWLKMFGSRWRALRQS